MRSPTNSPPRACKAAQAADELKNAVEAALAGGQVPPAFQGELERNAADLQNEVNCDEHQDKGKKKGRKHDDETTTLGTTVGTTTVSTTTTSGAND